MLIFCIKLNIAQIAQSVEQRIENPRVGGSIPPLGTIDSKPRNREAFLFLSLQITILHPVDVKFISRDEHKSYQLSDFKYIS